jgi:serine/threonine protein kinase
MHRQENHFQDYNEIYASLNSRWRELCNHYLPISGQASIWRYSRESKSDDPEQGWKLHVAATVLNAANVLETVAPFLYRRGILFKAPVSLYELQKLNSGQFYGYSQVGKFLTVYPATVEETRQLANSLYRMTRRVSAPSVPFDFRYRPDGCVYYRYGAFKVMEAENPSGERVYFIREPHGSLVPDNRYSASYPGWVSHPFQSESKQSSECIESPLRSTFKAFRALTQRGKGGVYQALDLSVSPPRLCILKEGRKDGEVDWDGREGSWRVRHEGNVLAALMKADVNVPTLYSSFKTGNNHYLAMEFIGGESLNQWLGRRKRRLPIRQIVKCGARIAEVLATIHASGWVWRDCKPGNIILTKEARFRPVDFEGACRIDEPDPSPWGTRSYVPPEWDQPFRGQSRLPEDLYALGAVIYFMIVGTVPDAAHPLDLNTLRRNVPDEFSNVVKALLDPDPEARPAALTVAGQLAGMTLAPVAVSAKDTDAPSKRFKPRVASKIVIERICIQIG